MPIITISRELGSSGTFVALKLAEALKCNCYDQQIIHEIAEKLGKDKDQIADFDQETYNRMGVFFQEALSSIAQGGLVFHPFGIGPMDWDSAEMFSSFPRDVYHEKDYFDVLNQVINEISADENAVILGRGACHILKDHGNAYHFRLVANLKDRVDRIKKEQGVDDEKALEIIKSKDKAASSFVYDFFDADWNDSHNYHIVLNSSLIPPEKCVSTILNFLKRD
ncbi:MAG: cytidylate kinase-like family protein [Candidatus Rifleibacteriota bacterium]